MDLGVVREAHRVRDVDGEMGVVLHLDGYGYGYLQRDLEMDMQMEIDLVLQMDMGGALHLILDWELDLDGIGIMEVKYIFYMDMYADNGF